MSLIEQHLRGKVLLSSAESVGPGLDNLCESEISQFKVTFVVNQYVFWLQVSVEDILGMQELEHGSDLRNVELSLFDFKLSFASQVSLFK